MKTLRFVALTAAMVLTVWLAQVNQAHALPVCMGMNGQACTGTGFVRCTGGCSYSCTCESGHWDCGCFVA
jgi:hypothetical protein